MAKHLRLWLLFNEQHTEPLERPVRPDGWGSYMHMCYIQYTELLLKVDLKQGSVVYSLRYQTAQKWVFDMICIMFFLEQNIVCTHIYWTCLCYVAKVFEAFQTAWLSLDSETQLYAWYWKHFCMCISNNI